MLRESVVWLCAKNRVAEAEEIIRNAAKLNNITMPNKILANLNLADIVVSVDGDKASIDDGKMEDVKLLDKHDIQSNFEKCEKTETSHARYSIIDIFRNRHLTINTLCMTFLWSAICCIILVLFIYSSFGRRNVQYPEKIHQIAGRKSN